LLLPVSLLLPHVPKLLLHVLKLLLPFSLLLPHVPRLLLLLHA
jgi:hypothetical protein